MLSLARVGKASEVLLRGPVPGDWRDVRCCRSAQDDLYDACAAAWTAGRIAYKTAQHLPDKPEFDARGLRMEIVY